MQKFYHKCAALLLAVGLLFPGATALAQMPEEGSMAAGLSLVDSGLPQAPDNGIVLVVWDSEVCYIEVGAALGKLPLTVEINAGRKSASGEVVDYTGRYPVGVHWDTASVDCNRPGTYDITGALDSDALSSLGITNPDRLTAALTVAVQKRGPIETLSGKLTSVHETYLQLRLRFPILPEDATALYLERETEPGIWERLSVYGQTNFLEFSPKRPPEQFIAYRLAPPEPLIRLRIEVVGSLYAGISNEVEIFADGDGNTLLPPPRPGDKPDIDDDDGSSGGNRGGGTQGETDRPGKKSPKEPSKGPAPVQGGGQKPATETPAPIAASPESTPPKSAAPKSGAASAAATESGADIGERASSASHQPSTQETLAPAVEKPPVKGQEPPPGNGHAGKVAAASAAILVAGAGGVYLFKIRRKP